ncbi:MAG: hypothetical protein WBO24_07085, partial [Nitrospirales bacterium]
PLHLWVIMVACENFPSLHTTYRQNGLNLKYKYKRMSSGLFPVFAERIRIFALKRVDAQVRRQVVIW